MDNAWQKFVGYSISLPSIFQKLAHFWKSEHRCLVGEVHQLIGITVRHTVIHLDILCDELDWPLEMSNVCPFISPDEVGFLENRQVDQFKWNSRPTTLRWTWGDKFQHYHVPLKYHVRKVSHKFLIQSTGHFIINSSLSGSGQIWLCPTQCLDNGHQLFLFCILTLSQSNLHLWVFTT